MFIRHHLDKFILPLMALLVFLVISYQPKYHLRSSMPQRFFPGGADSKRDRSTEEKIARAYWESAQMDVQWKYSRVQPLPIEPAPEFRVDAQELGAAASDPVTRMLYWHRLRQLWVLPEAWQQDYEWNFSWVQHPITAIGEWIRDRMSHVPSP